MKLEAFGKRDLRSLFQVLETAAWTVGSLVQDNDRYRSVLTVYLLEMFAQSFLLRVFLRFTAPLKNTRTQKFKATTRDKSVFRCSPAPLASDYCRARGNQIIENSSENQKILCAT